MHCAACAGRVERALAAVPGVRSARVNLVTGEAAAEFDPRRVGPPDLVAAVERIGYQAQVLSAQTDPAAEMARREAREAAAWRRRWWIGLALLLPLVALTHFGGTISAVQAGLAWALATPLQFYVGWPFLVGAAQRLRFGSANMDSLIALGTTTAYVAGVAGLVAAVLTGASAVHHGAAGLAGSAAYLADAGMIVVFITLGRLLEVRAKGRASAAIRRLLDLRAPEATVVRGPETLRVPVAAVLVGDSIIVRPGEKIPLDAKVTTGTSAVDQSWLTGESLPVDKGPGDEIFAGTINGPGALSAAVVRPAGGSALAQVIELVRRAQESKTNIGRLADRVVAWFVPAVLAVAVITLLAWGIAGQWSQGLTATIAVLVVACPCALGLATPTAVLVGSGRGAELGILIKEARALEAAGQIDTVLLDKTGTVTLGRPTVTAVVPAAGAAVEELLAVAAGAEQLSQHPLAHAVLAEAQGRGLEVVAAESLDVVAGAGVRAMHQGQPVLVGNERLLAANRVDFQALQSPLDEARSGGATPLLVARGGRLLGLVAVSDPIAPHSAEAIAAMQAHGLAVHLVSGDNRRTVEGVARQLHIAEFTADVLPGDKQQVVARLKQAGRTVAMVGDGINDAPALAAADLGIAIGSGADVALETADVVLIGRDLRAVLHAIALSRATLRTIRQNLGWAFGYNLLLLPLAAGVLVPWGGFQLPPAAAAAAMAASSVSVVTNSLLLRYRRLGDGGGRLGD